LKPKPSHIEFSLTPADNRRLASLCGSHDEHLKQIEEYMGVEIANRGNVFRVTGAPEESNAASQVLKDLYDATQGDEALTLAGVHVMLQKFAARPGGRRTIANHAAHAQAQCAARSRASASTYVIS
jgi:phosphate starvation-inducible PhoH-like protein